MIDRAEDDSPPPQEGGLGVVALQSTNLTRPYQGAEPAHLHAFRVRAKSGYFNLGYSTARVGATRLA